MGAIKYTALSFCSHLDVSMLSSSCAEILEALGTVSQKTNVRDRTYYILITLCMNLPIKLLYLIPVIFVSAL